MPNDTQRIEIITRNHTGKPVLKEFEPAAEASRSAPAADKGNTDNDEVSLF